eukprot:940627_1
MASRPQTFTQLHTIKDMASRPQTAEQKDTEIMDEQTQQEQINEEEEGIINATQFQKEFVAAIENVKHLVKKYDRETILATFDDQETAEEDCAQDYALSEEAAYDLIDERVDEEQEEYDEQIAKAFETFIIEEAEYSLSEESEYDSIDERVDEEQEEYDEQIAKAFETFIIEEAEYSLSEESEYDSIDERVDE